MRRGRLEEELGRTALAEFLAWDFPTVSSDTLIQAAYNIAVQYDCALYDGLYLALAEEFHLPLLHADLRLRNTLNNRFPHELWIEDFE